MSKQINEEITMNDLNTTTFNLSNNLDNFVRVTNPIDTIHVQNSNAVLKNRGNKMNFKQKQSSAKKVQQAIVCTDNGIDIEQSLHNVRKNAVTWHKQSTARLYNVLGECYELYYLIETADKKQRDLYRDSVKNAYETLNGAQRANKLITRIISIVFDFADLDRKQRSRYGSVITNAFSVEPKLTNATDFTQWITSIGGIVAATQSLKKINAVPVEQSEINETVSKIPAKATIKLPNSGNKFVVILASPTDNNTVDIIHQFEDDTLGDLLAKKVYKLVEKELQEAQSDITAASIADSISKKEAK